MPCSWTAKNSKLFFMFIIEIFMKSPSLYWSVHLSRRNEYLSFGGNMPYPTPTIPCNGRFLPKINITLFNSDKALGWLVHMEILDRTLSGSATYHYNFRSRRTRTSTSSEPLCIALSVMIIMANTNCHLPRDHIVRHCLSSNCNQCYWHELVIIIQ